MVQLMIPATAALTRTRSSPAARAPAPASPVPRAASAYLSSPWCGDTCQASIMPWAGAWVPLAWERVQGGS
eukprot:5026825-Prymnesium_polylepis.1